MITNELGSVTVLISSGSGASTINQIVPFRVYRESEKYKAIPLIEEEERKKVDLPSEFFFEFINHTIIPAKGTKEHNLDAIRNIVQELKMQEII